MRPKTIGSTILLLVIVLILCSYQRGTAESGTNNFSIVLLRLAALPTQTTLALDTAVDPRVQAIAMRLRERTGERQTARQRKATLAAMSSEQAHAFATLEQQMHAAVEIRLRPTTGTPMQIVGPTLQLSVPEGIPGPDRDEKTARTFLRTYGNLLRLDNPDQELALAHHDVDHLHRCHLRFSQQHRNLPVWPAEVMIHLNPQGHVDVLEGAFIPTPRKLVTDPVITAQAASAQVRAIVPDNATAISTPELIVYAPVDTAPHLAWKMEVAVSDTAQWLVVIDAINGATLAAYNQVMDANVAGSGIDLFGTTRPLNVFSKDSTFYMIDTSKPMFDPTSDPPELSKTRGAIVVLDAGNHNPDSQGRISVSQVTSNSATSGWIRDAVSASFSLSQTYDYYLERHNRNSLDGQGGTMLAIVRLGTNYNNAFWNGQMMVFGDVQPFAGALDVVAHELTHGVTQYSANLIYLNQSGALNEAFSDIFGEATEARTNGGGPDWQVGAALGKPLRNLANPSAIEICSGCGPYPQQMSEFISTSQDNGGVHINSTIISHAFYLLSQGLNGAIGIRDAERIFYRALTTHLVRNSQFIDARLACIQSAIELFGAGSPQAIATAAAFDQVQILAAAPSPEPPPLPPVNGPDATLFLRQAQSGLVLGRREEGRGDSPLGVRLSASTAKGARPSVSGDGSFAVFISDNNDACFVDTNGQTGESCLGFPGLIGAASISRDAQLFGVVLLDNTGQRDNRISVIDIRPGQQPRTYILTSPAIDGVSTNTVRFADSMDFTADNRVLIYDAFNEMTLVDGTRFGVWSIYALDLATNTTNTVVPPTRGIDIGFPRLSRTSDNFLTFDRRDQAADQSTISACKLSTGDCTSIATVNGDFGVPSYTGDDTAIIYSQTDTSTPTGFSLLRQPLASDRQTPTGAATLWLSDADFNVIYRRATAAPSPGGVTLENPAPGSFQSGIGLISGWICNASRVEIDVDGRGTFEAAYGTGRGDTQTPCGDVNNGFGLLVNWNLLGNGTHSVRILADGKEVANSTFTVATLGLGEFPRGLGGAFLLPDFPQAGKTTRVQWDERAQNFVVTNPSGSSPGGGRNNPGSTLENPAPGSFQSGIGLISGWICNASRVEVDVDGRGTFQAAYGTGRGDTQTECNDTNNGYGLLVNWNLLGDGAHSVRVLADGVEVGTSTFTVATLGLGEFPRNLSGTFTLPGFPQTGKATKIRWQESIQNFTIIAVQ